MKNAIFVLILCIALPCTAQWKTASENEQILAFGVHDTSLFISVASPEQGVFRFIPTGAPGSHWAETDSGIDFTQGNITSFASLGRYFFAGSGPPNQGIGFLTTNNGEGWTEPIGGPIGTNGTYMFGQYATRIARSRDSGKTNTWEHLSAPAGSSYVGFSSYVFTNTPSNGLWRSTDSGGTWAQISSPFSGNMTVIDSLLFITSKGLVIQTKDCGTLWDTIAVDSGGAVPETVNVLVTDGKNLFAGTTKGVYLSMDTGKTWLPENQGLTYLDVDALGVFDTLLFVNTPAASPLYYTAMRSIPEMTDTTPASVVQTSPHGDTIEIYPNPATGMVTIMAGGTSILAITVLNVLGENVLALPNLRESDISLDISKLPSGTYFLQIQSTSGTVIRKIVKEE